MVELLVARGVELTLVSGLRIGPVELKLHPGMRVALTGAAGSGISELLQLFAGQLAPERGSVQLAPGVTVGHARAVGSHHAEQTVWEYASQALRPLQQLEAQLRTLERQLDSEAALDRYGELAELFEGRGGYRAEGQLRELLAAFGLGEERHSQPLGQLSGGQRQRLELVRALSSQPDVVLLDEPAAGLDAALTEQLAERLAAWPGAVIFSSHDRHFINRAASHTANLTAGRFTLRRGGFSVKRRSRAPSGGAQRRQLLATEGLRIELGPGDLLFSGPLEVAAGERIVLLGENGSGKSSLLNFVAHDHHHGSGTSGLDWAERVSVSHYGQSSSGLKPQLTARENLAARMSHQRAAQLLGLVRLTPARWDVPAEQVDQGERARTGLALLLADEAELLLLDEPETGLDLPGIELLEDALASRPGAVIAVTHDRQLAANIATRVWEIRDGELHDYRGGMAGYTGGRLRLERDTALQLPQPQPEAEAALSPAELIGELEDRLLSIEERLYDPLLLVERQRERLLRQQAELTAELMELYDAQLPEPAPRFLVREAGLQLQADRTAEGGLSFVPVAGVAPALELRAGVAHLRLRVPPDRCLLPWAERALLNAATRLAFYTLPVRVVQHWNEAAPDGLLLEEAGSGWHALPRSRFEELEGWNTDGRVRSERRRRERVA